MMDVYNIMCVPVIVILCYLIIEAIKTIVDKDSKIKELLPIISAFIGGILGALIYIFVPEAITSKNAVEAIFVGLISGLGATGSNQIFKQIKKLLHPKESSLNIEKDNSLKEVNYNPDSYLEIGAKHENHVSKSGEDDTYESE